MLRCSKGLAKSDRTYRISEKTERNVQVGLPLVTLCHANEIERVNNVGLAIAGTLCWDPLVAHTPHAALLLQEYGDTTDQNFMTPYN